MPPSHPFLWDSFKESPRHLTPRLEQGNTYSSSSCNLSCQQHKCSFALKTKLKNCNLLSCLRHSRESESRKMKHHSFFHDLFSKINSSCPRQASLPHLLRANYGMVNLAVWTSPAPRENGKAAVHYLLRPIPRKQHLTPASLSCLKTWPSLNFFWRGRARISANPNANTSSHPQNLNPTLSKRETCKELQATLMQPHFSSKGLQPSFWTLPRK